MLSIPGLHLYSLLAVRYSHASWCGREGGQHHLLSLTYITAGQQFRFIHSKVHNSRLFTSFYSAVCPCEGITSTCSPRYGSHLTHSSTFVMVAITHHALGLPQVNELLYAALLSDNPLDYTQHTMTAI